MFFLWAAFYVFAKLVKPTAWSRFLFSPAAEFTIEDCAHAANAILMLDRSCSACIVLRGVWRLFRQRYSKRWRARRPLHQHAAGESNCDRRANRDVQCCGRGRSEEHTSELQSLAYLVCRLLL